MSPQVACLRRCIITLIACVWLFSAVHFHMSPQFACLRRGIITLVAFVWLFPPVRFHMSVQSADIRGCIFTLVALVWHDALAGFCHSHFKSFYVDSAFTWFIILTSNNQMMGRDPYRGYWISKDGRPQQFWCPLPTGSWRYYPKEMKKVKFITVWN